MRSLDFSDLPLGALAAGVLGLCRGSVVVKLVGYVGGCVWRGKGTKRVNVTFAFDSS
jgi:hypothetical protein